MAELKAIADIDATTRAPSLPIPLQNASGAVCGSEVYMLGGVSKGFFESKASCLRVFHQFLDQA